MIKNHLIPKNVLTLIAALAFLFIHKTAIGQKAIATEDILLFRKIADTMQRPFDPAKPYYIIIWIEGGSRNVKIVRQLTETTAIVELKNQFMLDSLKQRLTIARATDQWKYSPFAERKIGKNNDLQLFILSASDINELTTVLRHDQHNVSIIKIDELSHSVLIRTSARYVKQKLLSLKELLFVDLHEEPHSEISIIGYNRSFHGINAVDYSIPGANGKNIVAGVKEQKMEEADLDLYKRVLPSSISSTTISNHATVISSIIGGSGNSFYDGRGVANACKFFPSTFSNLFADDPSLLASNKVTVQNHSYGTTIQQFYGAEAVSYDAHAWQNKNFIAVYSSGNSGTGSATEGPYKNIPGYANLTGNFKMAKNIITVGAIDNKGIVPAESSSGPLYDGRIAPQLVALGPNGTSDAAAIVTGTIAVMQQVYADSNNQTMPASSLIKAILYNNADDIFHSVISYKTGYGLLNSFTSIKALQQKEYDAGTVSQNQQWTRTIPVPPNAAQLKVTLAWTDSAAAPNNDKALINDLDLEITEISNGTTFKPWVLSTTPNADSLAKLPMRKRDSLNTTEQVSIALPAAGNYQIKITGSSILTSSAAFNVAYHIDTLNTFHFTSPQHTSDVNRNENANLDIRWRTFVADTNQTGNLYISYNGGSIWQLIKAAQKLYTNYYQWPIKDTSSRAMFKMETSFGDFLSKEVVISKVTRLNIDFLCSDSVRLSWNKHIYAGSYKIYALTDSPYLKHVLTVSDTFTVLNRTQHPWLVYAAEPILTNNLPAARSVAVDISLQGVKCFYKDFYYALQDQNKLDLILELSAPEYVDSLYFEQVNSAGQPIRSMTGIKASNNSIYRQLVDDLPSGTTYWRVKMRMKNGAIIYTETISILTTGKRYILFYPNPVERNSTLAYLLQQNLPTDSKLQLYDITGRLLRSYSEIPNSIDLRTIPAGMIIYKLFSNDKRLLEVGKLIIR